MKTISEIREEFQQKFAYLRIIFFPGKVSEGDELMNNLTLGNLCKDWKEGQFLIHSFHSIKEVELLFARLRISVAIERKQPKGWMETRRSYYLSLDTHNEMGRLASQMQPFNIEIQNNA